MIAAAEGKGMVLPDIGGGSGGDSGPRVGFTCVGTKITSGLNGMGCFAISILELVDETTCEWNYSNQRSRRSVWETALCAGRVALRVLFWVPAFSAGLWPQ